MELKEKNTSIENYRKAKGVYFSGLSTLAYSPLLYKKNIDNPDDKKSSQAMNLGSCVDTLLTSEEDFYDNFYIMTAHKPESEMMVKYVEKLVETNDYDEAHLASGYKLSADKVKEKFIKEGSYYHEALMQSKDKIVLTFEEFSQCKNGVKAIKDKFPHLFSYTQDNIDIYYQVAIFWKYEEVDCKSLLDIVVVNHNDKTIQPIDIKTTSKSILDFENSYKYWKYYLQASFYSKSLEDCKIFSIERDSSNYKILPFQFLVAEMANIHSPYLFTVSDYDLVRGEKGGYDNQGNYIKGFRQLIEELDWHQKENKWEYPKEMYLRKELKIFAE